SAERQPFFTMRLVEGRTLSEAIRDSHALKDDPRGQARELRGLLEAFVAVGNAVAFAHSRPEPVIHRDLKPQNVVLGDFGEVFVLDWGLGKPLSQPDDPAEAASRDDGEDPTIADLSRPGDILGTAPYMAPEQAEGRTDEIDERTDVYGLGA